MIRLGPSTVKALVLKCGLVWLYVQSAQLLAICCLLDEWPRQVTEYLSALIFLICRTAVNRNLSRRVSQIRNNLRKVPKRSKHLADVSVFSLKKTMYAMLDFFLSKL